MHVLASSLFLPDYMNHHKLDQSPIDLFFVTERVKYRQSNKSCQMAIVQMATQDGM